MTLVSLLYHRQDGWGQYWSTDIPVVPQKLWLSSRTLSSWTLFRFLPIKSNFLYFYWIKYLADDDALPLQAWKNDEMASYEYEAAITQILSLRRIGIFEIISHIPKKVTPKRKFLSVYQPYRLLGLILMPCTPGRGWAAERVNYR